MLKFVKSLLVLDLTILSSRRALVEGLYPSESDSISHQTVYLFGKNQVCPLRKLLVSLPQVMS